VIFWFIYRRIQKKERVRKRGKRGIGLWKEMNISGHLRSNMSLNGAPVVDVNAT
jgi:hypothetical protein